MQSGPAYCRANLGNTMETREKKRNNLRTGLILGVFVAVWYVIAMFLVVRS
jgi:hypothetical protein